MTAIHHVKGFDGGAQKGGQGVGVPEVSIVVRSTFQTWFGRFATMVRPVGLTVEPEALLRFIQALRGSFRELSSRSP